jgi:hypothetical protein
VSGWFGRKGDAGAVGAAETGPGGIGGDCGQNDGGQDGGSKECDSA